MRTNASVFFAAWLMIAGIHLPGQSAPAQEVVDDKADQKEKHKIDVFGEAELTVPEAFKKTKPRSRIVQAEFVASEGEGDDKQTARVYGMASGGGIDANIARWKGQFTDAPEGAFKQKKMELGDWTVHLIDHRGKFGDRMGGGPFAPGRIVVRENYAMVGAILVNEAKRTYFVKMVGPKKVVKANRKDFVKMIKSIDEE